MNYEEMEMAQMILNKLPEWDALSDREIFYHQAWTFYLENIELMESFIKVREEKTFYEILEFCKEKNLPELYAVAMALKKARLAPYGADILAE